MAEIQSDSTGAVKVVALYKFAPLPDFEALRGPITDFCDQHGIKGSLLLAPEGINGTVAGSPAAIDGLIAYLMQGNIFKNRFANASVKYSHADTMPFLRMKVKLKQEIVTMRAPEANPNDQVGTYVKPQEWNALLAQEGMILLDTRNEYEVDIGTFENAIDPKTASFTQFKDFVADTLDPKVNKKIAMFCTGGIRCEKASAYMLAHGFEEVYHLDGGILRYLEEVPQDQSKWHGECFVFDERVSVGHGLEVGDYGLCRCCRMPLAPQDFERPEFELGVQCHHCADTKSEEERARARERQKQMQLAQQKGQAHLGSAAVESAAENRERNEALRAKTRQG